MGYTVILPDCLPDRTLSYLRAIESGGITPGAYLQRVLATSGPALDAMSLIDRLLHTKRPQIFAESAVAGDGRDWNAIELHLLGDISIATHVEVFDDGRHHAPTPHVPPFPGTLVFTCGALLANGHRIDTPDLREIAPDGSLDQTAYDALYARRLRPVLAWIQRVAEARGRHAVVTVPGLGCGQFAGRFRGRMGLALQTALERLLSDMAAQIPHIRVVIFDPYDECRDRELTFSHTQFRVRPLLRSGNPHPQLCRPVDYAESGDDFRDCDLFSLVAWDQVSWPGNDFYAGARATDDGVKAAATSSMYAMTGIEGYYDAVRAMYLPPRGYRNWRECVERNGLGLELGEPFVGG